jgi:hypothetical protein
MRSKRSVALPGQAPQHALEDISSARSRQVFAAGLLTWANAGIELDLI